MGKLPYLPGELSLTGKSIRDSNAIDNLYDEVVRFDYALGEKRRLDGFVDVVFL